MEWRVFRCWLEALKRRNEPKQADPHSWANHQADPWWAEARAKRDALRQR